MFERLLLLIILLLLGIFSKNDTIVIAIIFLLALVLFRVSDDTMTQIKNFTIKYGIVLISIYAFIPIAKGDITLNALMTALTTWRAWVAIFAGVLVTYFAKYGIEIMDTSPDVTTFVLIGIIVGILVFKGVPSGPLIGSGIALMLYGIIDFVLKIFT